MNCPVCNIQLEQLWCVNMELDYCPQYHGFWFDQKELEMATHGRDRDLEWLHVDLWRDKRQFETALGEKPCPVHRLPMMKVGYGTSAITIDVCRQDYGVWLDRGEFKSIIGYLNDYGVKEQAETHLGNINLESWGEFAGPEMLREEVLELQITAKLLRYRVAPVLDGGVA